ncbi:MAG: alanyl-tRNA editing protein [Candidatus Daviesbacteria bacterium]|nr:alanyl-tRNA editing protein [Candidatus Daviesbacteria bacterium]
MKTSPLYLDDSYLKEMDAEILEVLPEGEGRFRVVLDKTVFYPMGGGQATDQGKLEGDNWSGEVYQILNKDGEIWHFVKSNITPTVGMKVHGTINWDRRYKNMKLHSAGHIVDFAMYILGFSPKTLVPLKADHDKNPHIVYQGNLSDDISGASLRVKQKLENEANELVSKNLEFSWYFQPLEDLQKEAIYLQPGLPTNKPLRTLKLESVGAVADGGTQVKHTTEVGEIKIESIENQDNLTLVRYSIVP